MQIMVSGKRFVEVCVDNGVGLAPEIKSALFYSSVYKNGNRFAPTLTLNGLVRAGTLLRERPGISLVENTLEIPDDFAFDTPALTLANVLNTSLRHKLGHPNGFISRAMKETGFCKAAEARFFKTVQALDKVKPDGKTRIGAEIITSGGRPIILRKNGAAKSGNNTGLTLEETVINGVLFPAGSIVRMITKPKPGETTHAHVVPATKLEITPKEDVLTIAFLRLSAFALKICERDELVMPTDQVELARRDKPRFRAMSVEEIACMACYAVAELDEGLAPA